MIQQLIRTHSPLPPDILPNLADPEIQISEFVCKLKTPNPD